jgi:SAM-dependent methyltransferase
MELRRGSLPKELTASMMPRWTRATLRGPMKSALRGAVCATADAFDRLRGRADAMTPPCRMRVRVGCFMSYVRLSRYRAVAAEFLPYLRDLGGLHAGTRMLDVGCGCGQIAGPLTQVLGVDGSYDGVDPDRQAIDWCVRHISEVRPNFRFTHVDVENAHYHPAGRIRAAEFRFPYADGAFDVILLKSVFTHLQKPALENYLAEIHRMLAPAGRVIASFLLLNDESEGFVARGASSVVFPFAGDGCRFVDARTPEYLIAHDERSVRRSAAAHRLAIESIAYGSWSGRPSFLSYQDLIMLSRDEPDGRP